MSSRLRAPIKEEDGTNPQVQNAKLLINVAFGGSLNHIEFEALSLSGAQALQEMAEQGAPCLLGNSLKPVDWMGLGAAWQALNEERVLASVLESKHKGPKSRI